MARRAATIGFPIPRRHGPQLCRVEPADPPTAREKVLSARERAFRLHPRRHITASPHPALGTAPKSHYLLPGSAITGDPARATSIGWEAAEGFAWRHPLRRVPTYAGVTA
jgi:hypothetical protein